MIPSPTGIAKVMDGLLLWSIECDQQNPITTPTLNQPALEHWTLLLGYLTTSGFQHIWQIKLDYSGNIMGASVM
jgi:hypothetical protein